MRPVFTISRNFIRRCPDLLRVAAAAWLCMLAAAAPARGADSTPIFHELEVKILHQTQTLRGKDTLHLPAGTTQLRAALRPGVRLISVEGADHTVRKGVVHLAVKPADTQGAKVVLRYEGIFDDPFEARPFSMDNPGQGVTGTITPDAAFFLGGSGWYPWVLTDAPQRFRVSITAPRGIYAVMEGRLEEHADHAGHSLSTWSVDQPSGPLAMFAGPYVIKERLHGQIRIATYFLADNAGLADRYLDASARHIRRYESLHGPYPFAKFAVVENFFPTGYGFPSYTLLGSRVLRLPFIPEISLRHEVAHCWWGNGVFVDPAEGNWAEGLATYVADYLSEEERSPADALAYRRRTLEKYAQVAAGDSDFPLSDFHSRRSPASQAVGYGKAMFVFHMMRQWIGDEAFWAALRDVYARQLFKRTGWNHFMDAFARHGGLNPDAVKAFHDQWITRTGALQLAMEKPLVTPGSGRYHVSGEIVQSPPWFSVDVPVTAAVSGGTHTETVPLTGKTATFDFHLPQRPETLSTDPGFDLFRMLYPEEIPATVNALKGAENLVSVIADNIPGAWTEIFKGLLAGLNHGGTPVWTEQQFAARNTTGQAVIFFGMPAQAKGRALLSDPGNGARITADILAADNATSSQTADTLFAVFKHPQGLVAVFLPQTGTAVDTVLRTARKITHYGRYSRLFFKRGTNIGKDIDKPSGSPLTHHMEDN